MNCFVLIKKLHDFFILIRVKLNYMPSNYLLTHSKKFAHYNSILPLTTNHINFINKQQCYQKRNLNRINFFYYFDYLLTMYTKNILFLSITLPTLLLFNNNVACAQFMFSSNNFNGQSRFMNFVPKTTRDIAISVIKNISEDTSIHEVLLTFKAEDKSLPNYNLTYVLVI